MPPARPRLPCLGLLLGVIVLAGCATRGPNHVYFTAGGGTAVQDLGPAAARLDRAVAPGEQVLGLAYDFNTDHLFLRIAPAQVIRVIERPSGKILREMPLPRELQTPDSADLAIRSGDRHLFAVHPDGRSIVELTLFGEMVRSIRLGGLPGPINGLACDQRAARLLVLTGGTVRTYTFEGRELAAIALQGDVRPVSLGYDSDARHWFVPLADGITLGEFDESGKLVASHPAGPRPITAIDAGPRSFVRVF